MEVNVGKTKYMVTSQNCVNRTKKITKNFQPYTLFKYLYVIFTTDTEYRMIFT